MLDEARNLISLFGSLGRVLHLLVCRFAFKKVKLSQPGVAAELVDQPSRELDITARKIKYIFNDELVAIRDSGGVEAQPHNLHTLFRIVDAVIKTDVEANEGINSVLRRLTTRAPAIKLPLLSARVGLKHALGLAGGAQSSRMWSRLRPRAAALLERCFEMLGSAGRAVLSAADRWEVPRPATNDEVNSDKINRDYANCKPHLRCTPPRVWAAKFCLWLRREFKTPDDKQCVLV